MGTVLWLNIICNVLVRSFVCFFPHHLGPIKTVDLCMEFKC